MSRMSRRGFLIGTISLAGVGVLGVGEAAALESSEIIDCEGWGARPNKGTIPVWDQRPVKIIVHHTATPNVPDLSQGAADVLARTIQKFHMDRRGWIDTGQHFTISRGGFVLEGRHRSLEALRAGDRQVEGAHCVGQNVLAVGIENQGTYMSGRPPSQLWNSLRALCAYTCQQYGIDPTEIYGHRDFNDTACPGDGLYGLLPQLRSQVADGLGQSAVRASTVSGTWPLLRIGDRGPAVLAAQHLLRAVGERGMVADGQFDRRTADAVRRFQAAHRTGEVNGLLGGGSWPLLVGLAGSLDDADVAKAVQALNDGRPVRRAVHGPADWQALLAPNN